MGKTLRLAIVPFGLSVSVFFVITYVLCILFGLYVSDQGVHQLIAQVTPGFTWLTWPSFFIGLIWSFVVGWYVAVVYAPLFNFFVGRAQRGVGPNEPLPRKT